MNKRFIATILLLGQMSGMARADALDDFKKARDKAIDEYDRIVRNSITQTRDIALPNFASLNIRFARSLMFEDFAELQKTANDLGARAEELSRQESARSALIKGIIDDGADLSGFEDFLHELTDMGVATAKAKSLEEQLTSVTQSIKKYKTNTESICPLAISMMSPDDLVFPPPQSVAPENPNLKLVSPFQFGSDELGRGAFILSVSSGVAAAIMMFIINHSLGEFIGLFVNGTLFVSFTGDAVIGGATTTVGGGAAGSGAASTSSAGSGAFSTFNTILVVAAVVAMLVVGYMNEQKKEEARKAVRKLYDRFEEIRTWYLANRVGADEVQEKVKSVCEDENKELVNGRKGLIFESLDAVEKMDRAASENLAQIGRLRITLEKNKTNYEKALAQYQNTLALTLSQDFLAEHRAAVISQAKAASAWSHFNETIKPRWTEYSRFYASNMKNCPLLLQKAKEIKLGINVHLQMINDQLDAQNSDAAQWSEIKSITEDLQKRIDGRAASCKPSDDEVIPDDIPLF